MSRAQYTTMVTLGLTQSERRWLIRHARVGGHTRVLFCWTPAFAGATILEFICVFLALAG